MKKFVNNSIIVMGIFFLMNMGSHLQGQPEPPVVPGYHGQNGNSSPQGAPLGDGSEVLIILGVFYAARKYAVHLKNRQKQGDIL